MEEANQKSLLMNQELIVENNEEVTQEVIENRITEAKEIDAFFKDLNFFDKTPEEFENLLSNFVTTFRRHSRYVESVSFSPDGSMIASGSHDK